MAKERNGFPVRLLMLLLFSVSLILLVHCGQPAVEVPPPPETKVNVVTEEIHGVEVTDPYRWLEDQESPETRAWIDAQNKYTDSILKQIPGREGIQALVEKMMKVDEISIPFEKSGRFFYSKRAADQDLDITYWREGLEGEEKVLIDPHPMSADHTTSAFLMDVSQDGKLALYGVRLGGVDEFEVRFLDVDTGEHLPDTLPTARYYGVSLMPDKSGYYYTRRNPEGPRLYYRAMGSTPEGEALIFGEGVDPRNFVYGGVTDDAHYLIMAIGYGWNRSDVFIKDLTKRNAKIETVVQGIEANFQPIYEGGKLYMLTNFEAPNWKLMLIDPAKLDMKQWTELIPQRENAVLESVTAAGGKLFGTYLENVQSRIVIFDTAGLEQGEIKFDSIGSVTSMIGKWESDTAFYGFSSFHMPFTIYRYTVSTGESQVWAKIEVPIDSSKYEVKQVWYDSKDGTKVPMFIVNAKGIKLDGENPVYLTGYGGFGVSFSPYFSTRAAVWLELGGVYAVANLRGGGEFGEKWHKAGMLGNKQNVFDDFIAAAEYLIKEGYTKPAKLAIEGASNGGLLVMAMATQRPDLYGAIICGYPLIDMVRYHMFLVGSTWIAEYGSSEDPEQFKYIFEYSPYHHVRKGEEYPAILFITGDGDTRVAPLHARKMTALLQAATGSKKPIMLRYHTKAGHSGGQPVSEQITNTTETMLFLTWQLGMKAPEAPKAPAAQ
jgi:prolyl oligopeptidase